MKLNIKIAGIQEAVARLDALAADAEAGLKSGLARGAELVKEDAQARCPVRTGRLRDSIAVSEEDGGVSVGSDLDYAAEVEFGSEKRPPKPYLVPGLKAKSAEVVQAVRDEVGNAL